MESRGYPNRLGIRGWVGGGRWGFERYLYTLHRVTGLGLLLYLVLHIFVTSVRIYGPARWNAAMESVSGPVFKVGEYLVFLAFAFHAVNGVRLGMI
jgi:succinate dehydrogenase / fumarate reductase cytochrome b subunit